MVDSVSLDDKYKKEVGRAYLNGTQAIVRLLLLQHWKDQAAGLNTGGFISGYRGSPLAGLDQALWQAARHLLPKNIHFKPAINEELGATSVWGTQQVGLFPGATTQGVFSLWYGKGPGVDRSGDVLKHANAAGTSPHGGVLVLAGDDHLAKSSSLPHQSEFALIDAGIPILHPSRVEEIISYGLFGWAMSRYSGCWVGLKLTGDVVDTTTSMATPPAPSFVTPLDFLMPASGLHIRWPDPPLAQEKRLLEHKLPAAQAFAYANHIDVIQTATPKDVCGIVATGKAYQDVLQALLLLGIDENTLQKRGIRLYKVALAWPLEPRRALEFAKGLKAILVVEEKRPLIEDQLKSLLFNTSPGKTTIMGKKNLDQSTLLPAAYELNPTQVAKAIVALLDQVDQGAEYKERIERLSSTPSLAALTTLHRTPFYCSGCPHNTSTKTLEGSRTLAGIGCHYMAMWIDDATATFSQMGGEGVPWIGQAPFTSTNHVFANLGDGTYFHSGSLAIRAAVAAGINITYKVLFNDAVAMTGGQPMDGQLTPSDISLQVYAEGVKTIAVVSDEPDKYPIGSHFAPPTTFHHRHDLSQVEERLRDTPGVSVIIYDQTCAAEKRRRRKRKLMVDPPKRVFINELVCEGCGDCGKASNCLSLVPKETEFGRKRAIDQSSCNKDFSCLEGFCPSFVTVEGGVYKPLTTPLDRTRMIPEPEIRSLDKPFHIVIAGIGGTGVVTIGALLTMAAHMEGKGCSALDMTGLSQKGGAVSSHIKIAPTPAHLKTARLEHGTADLVLGADALVTSSADILPLISKDNSHIILNTEPIATGQFTKTPDEVIPIESITSQLSRWVSMPDQLKSFNFSALSLKLFGDLLPTNMIILGYTYQLGLIPLKGETFEKAIHLNAASLQMNLDAFYTGRRAAFDPPWAEKIIADNPSPPATTLEDMVQKRIAFLTNYQNKAYAQTYEELVKKIQSFEVQFTGQDHLTRTVAKYLFKVMAYKDEYEVARLYTDSDFIQSIQNQIKGESKIHVHLAPPLLANKDPLTGHLRKKAYGPWVLKVFKNLAKLKPLRGTPFDVFGYTQERKAERQLIDDYKSLLKKLIQGLTLHYDLDRYALAIELASLPELIRGFGHVKEASMKTTYEKWAELMKRWDKITC